MQENWSRGRRVTSLLSLISASTKGAGASLGGELRQSWFRGQADYNWDLAPTALRSDFLERAKTHFPGSKEPGWDAEFVMNRQFLQLGARLLPDPGDLPRVYLTSRHHGLPTRLLDWTRDLRVAAYFAVSDERFDDQDAAIWEVTPRWTVKAVLSRNNQRLQILTVRNAVSETHPFLAWQIPALFDEAWFDLVTWHQDSESTVVPVVPVLPLQRSISQSSCFTFHGIESRDIPGSKLWKHKIPAASKDRIRRELQELTIDGFSVFGDLDSLARGIRARM